jgi:hypothetical protein
MQDNEIHNLKQTSKLLKVYLAKQKCYVVLKTLTSESRFTLDQIITELAEYVHLENSLHIN